MNNPTPEQVEQAARALFDAPKLVRFTSLVPGLTEDDVAGFWQWFEATPETAFTFYATVAQVVHWRRRLDQGLSAEDAGEMLVASFFRAMLAHYIVVERRHCETLIKFEPHRMGVLFIRTIQEPATQRE
ncbi:MAG TPA: hypothetical protein VG269_26680 [Tepidisphaeraceae bacterium]|jgi:hypothetical protein|nr:hypothetical protein [Tepidisphaeraceae bacterium]